MTDFAAIFQLALAIFLVAIVNFVILHDETIMVAFVVKDAPRDLQQRVINSATAAAIVFRLALAAPALYLFASGQSRNFAPPSDVVSAILGGAIYLGIKRLWIAWAAYREMRHKRAHRTGFGRLFFRALFTELSNAAELVGLLAVAAGTNVILFLVGLLVSLLGKSFATMQLVSVLERYRWVSLAAIFVVVWYGLVLIYEGSHEVGCAVDRIGCSESLGNLLLHRLSLN